MEFIPKVGREDRQRAFVVLGDESVHLLEGVVEVGADALGWPVLRVGRRKTKSRQRESRKWLWKQSWLTESLDEPFDEAIF